MKNALADRLSPEARLLVVRAKHAAMTGRFEDALKHLDAESDDGYRPSNAAERLAIGLTHAELLHLDFRSAQAVELLDQLAEQLLPSITINDSAILKQARNIASFGAGWPDASDVDRHHEEIDERHLTGTVLRDADLFLRAGEAAAAGKHYDAYPIYANAMFDAYRRFHWRGIKEAAEFLGRELLALGSPAEAIFPAMLSEDETTLQAVADALRATSDSTVVVSASAKLLRMAHLGRHVVVSAIFISQLDDAVPDAHISDWMQRFEKYRHAPFQTVGWNECWEATVALLDGASSAEADQIVHEIIAFPDWHFHDVFRHRLMNALIAAVQIASEAVATALAHALVAIAGDQAAGVDFPNRIGLLQRLGHRFPNLKKVVREALYGPGARLNAIHVQAASSFDVQLKPAELEAMAEQVALRVRQQVERKAPGEAATEGLGGYGTFGRGIIDGQAVTAHMFSAEQELAALGAHHDKLSAKVIDTLVASCVEMINDPGNININRQMLLERLLSFIDSLSRISAAAVVEVASKFAANHRHQEHPLFGQEEDHQPLNAFRIGSGWPQEVRGTALTVLGALTQEGVAGASERMDSLLISALGDRLGLVRREACRAIGYSGEAGKKWLGMVGIAAGDSDVEVARIALQIYGTRAEWVAVDGIGSLVLGTIAMRAVSGAALVRQATARLAAKLKLQTAFNGDVDDLLSRLSHDVCRRVRYAAIGRSA